MDELLYHLEHDREERSREVEMHYEIAREIRAEALRRFARQAVDAYFAKRERARRRWLMASWITSILATATAMALIFLK